MERNSCKLRVRRKLGLLLYLMGVWEYGLGAGSFCSRYILEHNNVSFCGLASHHLPASHGGAAAQALRVVLLNANPVSALLGMLLQRRQIRGK